MSSTEPSEFDYTRCIFEARLTKPRVFRRQDFYLYMSKDFLIINQEPYAKRPEVKLELKPTTHVKWLWQGRSNRRTLRGFVIETEGYVNEFMAENVVLQMLKTVFSKSILQSEFYDEYDLGQYLDKGNYAQVYSCVKKSDQKRYAVKVMEKEKIKAIKNGKQSVFNELKILRALDHSNLLRLFQVFEDRNKYYFVMELLEGITLYKQISTRNKKPQTELKGFEIKAILRQILSGVAYLAQRNIMHRDLKPQNIIFQAKGKIESGLKIVDYGLATYQHEPHIIFTKCGTPGFVAPQIITYDDKVDQFYKINADMFSIGVILHVLLIKEAAFPGKSRNTILNKNKQAKIDFKSRKYECVASDGTDLLSRLLEKDPQKRISAKEALDHPFLTKDKPVYKFKKFVKDEEPFTMASTKMYKNLEDINNEEDAKNASVLKQSEFEDEFSPFSWPKMPVAPLKPVVSRNLINSIGAQHSQDQPSIYRDFLDYQG